MGIGEFIRHNFGLFFYVWMFIEISLFVSIWILWLRLMGAQFQKYRFQAFNPFNLFQFVKEFPLMLKEYPRITGFISIAGLLFISFFLGMIPFGLMFGKK
jgi:hypothetical protein